MTLQSTPIGGVWWGSQVYDARLVASMTVYGVGRILTFNARDFVRYGIEVIEPSAVS